MRVIFKQNKFRIIEQWDHDTSIEDLKGDYFKPEVNPYINADLLKQQEIKFEREVENEGVFSYELQIWDSEIDQGWTHVDSCYGFVGQYDEKNEDRKHYIVEELKQQTKEKVV